jgi:DNA polymerase I-like protein with 3'-5' exonuclease and polymerase domains
MYVDQAERHKREVEMLKRRHTLLEQIRSACGRSDFNPGSVYHMRDLLFSRWQLSTESIEEDDRYTGSGDLSTGDLILRCLLTDPSIPDHQRDVIKLIRRYRKVLKVLGTYVVKLRPSNMAADVGWDEDEEWADAEARKRYGEIKKGIVNPLTGRMHPGYNAHVAVTGRLSSSKPINAQNFPKGLRALIVAQPGNVLVGADMDQLELRIAAARWGVELYLRAFAEGKDPHSMTAFAIFGNEFCKAAGIDPKCFDMPGKLVGTAYQNGKFEGSGDAMSMRNLSKAVQYASQYMAKVETVHKLIQKTELPTLDPETKKPLADGSTDLPYAKLPLKKVGTMRDNWLKGAPQFPGGWDKEIANYRRHGYIQEEVTGRRRDFLDGEAPNEIVNFPIQGSAAGLMNKALVALYKEIPLHKWGPGTGIINQCHDSIVVECPESEGKKVAGMLEEYMNQTHPALPGVRFTAKATIGKTWKEVG